MSLVAKNTTYLTLAYIFQKVTAFVYFALIARRIGADLLGKYTFSLFFIILLSILIDLGLNQVLTREIAKYPEKTNKYFNNIFGLKIIFGVIVYFLAIALVNILNYPQITKNLITLTGLVMFLDALTQTIHATIRGHQNLKYEGLSTIIYQTLEIGIGAVVLILNLPVYGLVLAILAGSSGAFIYTISCLIKVYKVKIYLHFEKQIVKKLLKMALPFFIAGVLIKIYSYIDTVLITKLASDQALGFYSVPYKLVFSLQVLPLAFGASIYPAFSNFWHKSRELLRGTFERSLFYLMAISLPITSGTIALADQIIIKVYGPNYEPSVLALKILITSALFTFLTFPVGALLNACDRQKTNTRNIGIVTFTSLILSLILIPRFNFLGAAISALIGQSLLFFLGVLYVPQITPFNKKYLGWSFSKILFASVVMGIVSFLIKDYIHIIINIIISVIIYSLIILLTNTLTKAQLKEIGKLIFKKEG